MLKKTKDHVFFGLRVNGIKRGLKIDLDDSLGDIMEQLDNYKPNPLDILKFNIISYKVAGRILEATTTETLDVVKDYYLKKEEHDKSTTKS